MRNRACGWAADGDPGVPCADQAGRDVETPLRDTGGREGRARRRRPLPSWASVTSCKLVASHNVVNCLKRALPLTAKFFPVRCRAYENSLKTSNSFFLSFSFSSTPNLLDRLRSSCSVFPPAPQCSQLWGEKRGSGVCRYSTPTLEAQSCLSWRILRQPLSEGMRVPRVQPHLGRGSGWIREA